MEPTGKNFSEQSWRTKKLNPRMALRMESNSDHICARQVLLPLHQPCSKEMNNDYFSLGKSLRINRDMKCTCKSRLQSELSQGKNTILASTVHVIFPTTQMSWSIYFVTESLLILQYIPVVIFKT